MLDRRGRAAVASMVVLAVLTAGVAVADQTAPKRPRPWKSTPAWEGTTRY